MKISVALCTYNGSRFLREQLDSIAGQGRPPDELVICDDRSSDDTVEIAREFGAEAAFAVAVHVNDANLGSTANFAGAIERCTGDIIALSDQDDVWLPQKLERLEAEFASDARVGMVFSDATVVDEKLVPIGVKLWRETFRPHDQRMFAAGRTAEVLLHYNVVTGATMAIRRSLLPAIMPIPGLTEFIHDGWIALVASLCSEVRFIPVPLVLYRQHDGQQLGAGLSRWNLPRIERFRMTVESRGRTIERLVEFTAAFNDQRIAAVRSVALLPDIDLDREKLVAMIEATREQIDGNMTHLRARIDLPSGRLRRIPAILSEMRTGRYGRFSRGWESAVLDLVRR